MYEYAGAIHIHSTYSDGTGSVQHIADCANETNLDYLILTDHNNIQAKADGYERWFNNTMFLVGYELNDLQNRNHYLVMGLDELVGAFEVLDDNELGCKLSAKEYAAEIKKRGGTGFIAHPFEKRSSFPEHPPYPWMEWDTEDFDGIEIWNHMSEWVEGLNENNKIQRFIHPLKSIVAPDPKSVKIWDELNLKRRVTAVGCVDAHAHKMSLMGFYNVEIFPYKVLFKSIRTHVLLDEEIKKGDAQNFPKYKTAIINALKTGRSFIANSYHGDAKGFRFFAEYEGIKYQMGDEITIENGRNVKFSVYVPSQCKVKIMINGKSVIEEKGVGGLYEFGEEGCYRAECWDGDFGWIFSNHIRVRKV
jgi:hypothetical protein